MLLVALLIVGKASQRLCPRFWLRDTAAANLQIITKLLYCLQSGESTIKAGWHMSTCKCLLAEVMEHCMPFSCSRSERLSFKLACVSLACSVGVRMELKTCQQTAQGNCCAARSSGLSDDDHEHLCGCALGDECMCSYMAIRPIETDTKDAVSMEDLLFVCQCDCDDCCCNDANLRGEV